MLHFTIVRDALMKAHGWDRRVATLAIRLYRGVDIPATLGTTMRGTPLLTQGEYRQILANWP